MKNIKRLQKINLQIVKGYPLQQLSLVSLSLSHQDGLERLYFGTCQEPSNRISVFSDLDLFVKKANYYLHRSDLVTLTGLTPILYSSFYRNLFTNITFYGPSGIVQFLINIRMILGVRNLAFAALDLANNAALQPKYGVGNRASFIRALKEPQAFVQQFTTVKKINEFIQKYTKDYVNPLATYQNGRILNEFTEVVPIFQQNNQLVQYLVLFRPKEKIDYNWLLERKIPLLRIEEIKEGKFIFEGKKVVIEDLTFMDSQLLAQAVLVLHFTDQIQVGEFDSQKVIDALAQYEALYRENAENTQPQTLFIIHQSTSSVLASREYSELLRRLAQSKFKLINIVTSSEYFQNLDQGARSYLGREKFSFYFLDYLTTYAQMLPAFFEGRGVSSQFEPNGSLLNIEELWPEWQKVIPMRMKTMQLYKGNVYLEDLIVKRRIQFTLQHEVKCLLQRLYNLIQKSSQDFSKGFQLKVLGTSSSVENQSRSASCLLLRAPNGIQILLDCGQNSLSQLYFSKPDDQQFTEQLRSIKLIYVSHFHNDHHQGLVELLREKCQRSDEPFFLLIPTNVMDWYLSQIEEIYSHLGRDKTQRNQIRIISGRDYFGPRSAKGYSHKSFKSKPINLENLESEDAPFDQSGEYDSGSVLQDLRRFLAENDLSLELIYSLHCEQSTCIKIKYRKEVTFVYSADRSGNLDRRAQQFIDFAKDADMLVHECTYPDYLADKAYQVAHSTFLQALVTGYAANAKTLVLTHFSDRALHTFKNLINLDGTVDKSQFQANYDNYYSWPEKTPVDLLLNFFENKVLLANDFFLLPQTATSDLARLTRVILKNQVP